MKTALVCGAGGFIGSHLVKRLKRDSYFVIGVDRKRPEFSKSAADIFFIRDLRNPAAIKYFFDTYSINEVYQMASDLGGAGYIFSGDHDADIMHNSSLINTNIAECAARAKADKLFFPSSSCVYSASPREEVYIEHGAYPAEPDSEYGWEKLFSERQYQAYQRNYGLDVRIARFFSIFGKEGTWKGGKELAPAAICRKAAMAKDGDVIDIWGDGKQTRSYLYVDECVDGIRLLMENEQSFEPLGIGTEEVVSINELAEMIIKISGKKLTLNHIKGFTGKQKINFSDKLLYEKLNWKPTRPLSEGLEQTYNWIHSQVYNRDER